MSCIQEQPTEGVRPNARENGQIRPSTKRRGAGNGQHLASVFQKGRENANIDTGLGFIWRISVKIILHHSNALVFLISLSFNAAAQEAEIVRPRGALAAGTVAAVAAANAAGSSVAWPLHLSTQGKYLEQQNGQPFLLVADAGWEFMTQLTEEEAVAYLDDRKTKGFNAVEIRVIGRKFQTNAPNDLYNEPPFTNGLKDWSVRNEAYWTRIDFLLKAMRDRGMVAIMFPAYLGAACGDEGWCQEMLAQTDAAMMDYGTWMGNRYRNYGNIIWMTGGDTVATGHAASRNKSVVAGIRSVNPEALFSVEPIRGSIGGIDSYHDLVDINAVYAGDPATLTQMAYRSARPFMYQEGIYENEHGSTLVDIEAQALITYLGGGLVGHTFGSCPLWSFGTARSFCDTANPPFASWRNNLNSPGSIAVGKIGQLMRSRRWWKMVPDYANTVITGVKKSGMRYRAAAREETGETVMAWSPDGSRIAVKMGQISGTLARGWWFNADDGTLTDLGTFPTNGTRTFTPPQARQVLVLDDADRSLPPPGAGAYTGAATLLGR
jgi:Protein of unknown function (DUF4038)/Putative collagen-binding domain of a collagenase